MWILDVAADVHFAPLHHRLPRQRVVWHFLRQRIGRRLQLSSAPRAAIAQVDEIPHQIEELSAVGQLIDLTVGHDRLLRHLAMFDVLLIERDEFVGLRGVAQH